MSALGKAFVEIGVDFNKFRKSLSKAHTEFSAKMARMINRGKEIGGKIGRAIGSAIKKGLKIAAVAFAALAGAATVAFRAFLKSDEASSRLAKNIRASGEAAGFTAEQLEKMAEEMQDVSIFDDTDIKKAMAIIATFTNITGDNFKATTQAVMDMSAAMGKDLSTSALTLAKAMADPAARVGELGKQGLLLTKVQINLIRRLQETQGVVKAQEAMFRIFKQNALDGNSDATDRLSDRWAQFKNILEDSVVIVGQAVAEFFNLGDEGDGLIGMVKALREELKAMVEANGFAKFAEAGRIALKSLAKAVVVITQGFRALGTVFANILDPDKMMDDINKLAEQSHSAMKTIEKNLGDPILGRKKKKVDDEAAKKKKNLLKQLEEEKKVAIEKVGWEAKEVKLAEKQLELVRETAKAKRSSQQRKGLGSAFEFAVERQAEKKEENARMMLDNARKNVTRAKENLKQAERGAKESGATSTELKKQTDLLQKQEDNTSMTNNLLKGIGQNIGVFA